MVRYRTIRLLLHIGRHNTHYALVWRTVNGQDQTDRRLAWGQLPRFSDPNDPEGLIDLLERAVADLRRRHGIPPAAGGPGAPGGGGGRPLAGAADTIPLALVPPLGQGLDGAPADD